MKANNVNYEEVVGYMPDFKDRVTRGLELNGHVSYGWIHASFFGFTIRYTLYAVLYLPHNGGLLCSFYYGCTFALMLYSLKGWLSSELPDIFLGIFGGASFCRVLILNSWDVFTWLLLSPSNTVLCFC